MGRKVKKYEVEVDGRKAQVTVPETHEMCAYSGELQDILRDVLRDNLSPEAVAAIAGLIEAADVGGSAGKEVKWFRRLLVEALGGQDAYWTLWTSLTIQE